MKEQRGEKLNGIEVKGIQTGNKQRYKRKQILGKTRKKMEWVKKEKGGKQEQDMQQ